MYRCCAGQALERKLSEARERRLRWQVQISVVRTEPQHRVPAEVLAAISTKVASGEAKNAGASLAFHAVEHTRRIAVACGQRRNGGGSLHALGRRCDEGKASARACVGFSAKDLIVALRRPPSHSVSTRATRAGSFLSSNNGRDIAPMRRCG